MSTVQPDQPKESREQIFKRLRQHALAKCDRDCREFVREKTRQLRQKRQEAPKVPR